MRSPLGRALQPLGGQALVEPALCLGEWNATRTRFIEAFAQVEPEARAAREFGGLTPLLRRVVRNGPRSHWITWVKSTTKHCSWFRAALYAAILESRSRREESAPPPPASQPDLASAATEIDHAVSGLRRAGVQDYLLRGLLTRAWLRSLTGPATGPDSAQSDLDEAWEIAERGPMPLFLADIHLYRARLFFREKSYPWQSPQHDLAEARRLIFKHGYLRRKEELEDAEGFILGNRTA